MKQKNMCGACLKPLVALTENQKQMRMTDRNETSQITGIMQVCNYAIHLQKGSQITTQYSHKEYRAQTKL